MTFPARLPVVVFIACLVVAGRAAAQTPAAPTLLGPANGASVQVPFTISWSATLNPGAINGGYNWQVSRSSSFAPLVLADSTNPATTQDIVSGLTPGTYFWRVQAVNGGGQSAWSQARSFTVTGRRPRHARDTRARADPRLLDVPPVGVDPLRLDGRPGRGDLSPRGLERPGLPGGPGARRAPPRSGTTTSPPTATGTFTR